MIHCKAAVVPLEPSTMAKGEGTSTLRLSCLLFKSLKFTARKPSLGQGNVFTRVCHSVRGGGWLPSIHHNSHDQGSASRGGGVCIHREGVCIQRESASRGRGVYPTPNPRNWESGQYAFYWNVFCLPYYKTFKARSGCLTTKCSTFTWALSDNNRFLVYIAPYVSQKFSVRSKQKFSLSNVMKGSNLWIMFMCKDIISASEIWLMSAPSKPFRQSLNKPGQFGLFSGHSSSWQKWKRLLMFTDLAFVTSKGLKVSNLFFVKRGDIVSSLWGFVHYLLSVSLSFSIWFGKILKAMQCL